ncbi:cAMP-binding domain of CRP or a regulatory subunit of cAMP-dependent protein kinases [Chryseobacterium arachidis]|uniref:cAMP-binding domain of CRP or a regulatory subunit of cAMP-dependent protein kinases n=1 Tax=Chryseobacterium arachidis TaxID=1416778 RepID=A0A1M5C741_9FLAO|nr:Crp/Fnr family transcriptional regulator [Chryseobacterium arachidis]SHF50476.1 cAMP-binding domain of CRP or a regulatory subunit of cAMP-dependent protein kinases [Chryseobacterium arachidis]
MLINQELLFSYGGEVATFNTKEYIFEENQTPRYYHQIISGDVKLNHVSEDGKELIQSIHTVGDSVCELLLFIDEKYPVNAVTISECTVMKVAKPDFLTMLNDHRDVSENVHKYISYRLYEKFVMMQNIAANSADTRVRGILKYFKNYSKDQSPYSYEVKLTRQQLASVTGLRVETVIRSLKKLEKEKLITIEKGKVYY